MLLKSVNSATKPIAAGVGLRTSFWALEVAAHEFESGAAVTTLQGVGMLAQALNDPILAFVTTTHIAPALALIIFIIGMICTALVV